MRVFIEKVRRPDPRGLVRDRLEERLLSPGTPPIGLVLGPPGTGKTTLLSRVAAAAEAAGSVTAWYRVGDEDADEQALVCHLAHAIGTALGAQAVLDAGDAGTVDALVSALDELDVRPALLVVDDLHAVAGTRAEAALERFVALRPRSLRLLLGSRRPPALNISRLLVSGELCQLDSEDLRFRSWEVEELFRTVYQLPLSPETAAALTRRTGGWAAGLQLFHLGTAGLSRVERERAVAELSGRTRLIRSYLARNVLDGLEPGRRSFLLRACTLGVLTGDLCDALLETRGSAAVLDDLEQQQFFTTSTDGGLTFRFHQVLQTHLEVLLVDELGTRGARELYSRAGQLLEAAGRTAAAVRAHARADDWGAVARLVHQGSPPLPTDDDALWIGMPGRPIDDPGLVLAGARRLLRNGLVIEAVDAYRQAEALMDDPEFRARCAEERAQAALWLPQPQLDGPPPAPSSRRHVRLARELRLTTQAIHDPNALTTGLSRGVAQLLAGHPGAAVRTLEGALTTLDLAPWETLAIRLALDLAELWSGPTSAVATRLEEIVLSADVEGLPWLSRIARGLQAAALLVTSPSPWRITACADLLEDCERHGDQWALCLLAIGIGAALAIAGNDDEAVGPLRRAEEIANDLGAPVLQVWATAVRTAVQARHGDEQALADTAEVGRWAAALGADGAARLLQPGGLPGADLAAESGSGPWTAASGARANGVAHPALVPGAAAATNGRTHAGSAAATLISGEPDAVGSPGSASGPDPTGQPLGTPASAGSPNSASSPSLPASPASPSRSDPSAIFTEPITLRCLGGFDLRVSDRSVDPRDLRPRARALLMMLAIAQQRDVHRERLIDALWPDASLASGIRSLQVTVSSVRQRLAAAGLPEDCLRRHGDAYALRLPGVNDQVHDFEALARDGKRAAAAGDLGGAVRCWLAALDLYSGDLLPEVGPAEWVVEDRDRLRALAAEIGARAAEAALDLHAFADGIRAAQRSVELEPYHDNSWVLLAELHERRGDHGAAAMTRREHARVCAELGLPAPAYQS